MGAPIRNHRKEVFAAISVSGPSQRFDPPRIQTMAQMVIGTAEDISIREERGIKAIKTRRGSKFNERRWQFTSQTRYDSMRQTPNSDRKTY